MTAVLDTAGYDAAVERLYRRRPDRLVRGLHRIRPLVAALGDPQHAYRAVHVTATNGKTTIARLTAAILVAHGRRTGCYTSPHLQDVRERVRVDGAPIAREDLHAALVRVEAHLEEAAARAGAGAPDWAGDHPVTFFEHLTAAALLGFADAGVDVAVLEVGRGGQRDATNVVDGGVAAIGTVGLDHPELGSTVAEVAAEKAGLISPGSVVVSGPQDPAADAVIARTAAARGAILHRVGRGVDVDARPVAAGQRLRVRTPRGARLEMDLPLRGAHQAANAAVALAAAEAHLGALDPQRTVAALAGVHVPGRLEIVTRPDGVPVWLDGAHNPEGMRALAAALAPAGAAGRVVGVLAVRGDKDAAGLAAELAPAVDALVVAPSPCPPPAAAARLVAAARAAGHEPVACEDVGAALAAADRLADGEGVVVVTGSLPAVGAARDHLGLSAA